MKLATDSSALPDMTELSRRPSFAAFLSALNEPQIVLAALTRLRWLAVIGQLAATVLAVVLLRQRLPLAPIVGVIVITALTNAMLAWLPTVGKPPGWLVQVVLLLDVYLLTILLYLTGGPSNPFASLYLIHVAMAVIVLRAGWTWLVVATIAACYGVLLRWHWELQLDPTIQAIGNWVALVLVSVLITTFIGSVIRSLRQRERELASVRERAAKSEQLAALTTLAAGAAHELNTPLGTIAVVARELELSCNSQREGDSVLDDARLIRREVDRCQNILSRMRVDIGEEVSHRSIVSFAELEAHLRESLGEEQLRRLEIQRIGRVDGVPAPPRAIEQALLVLLRNAFDASGKDKPVTLKVERRGEHVRFEICDRGGGMSEEMLRRAGEPFFTTKEPGRGMGLGLFLVRLVAQQCGAKFSIDSTPGQGTTCILELSESPTNNNAC
jgi:two-component system sensor histidine kinase RegB